jgi:hypothetical protein
MDDLKQLDRPLAATGYDTDFYAWALDQAARIRALAVPGLDTENVAEEIESLGRSQRSELTSRCDVLLIHLLKWIFQPERRGVSWLSTIGEQRRQIQIVLADSPSLRPGFADVVAKAYRYAAKQAARETSLPAATFPASCPWTPEQIIDEDWMPADE